MNRIALSIVLVIVVCEALDGEWLNWSECSKVCGGGTQFREKQCTFMNMLVKCGKQTATCNKVACMEPLRFLHWNQCTKMCGGGRRVAYNAGVMDLNFTMDCNTFACSSGYACDRNLMVLVDTTGSVGVNNWPISKQLAIDVVLGSKWYGARKVALMAYSTSVKTYSPFGIQNDPIKLEKAIWDIHYTGSSTHMDSAMKSIEHNLGDLTPTEIAKTTVVIMNDGPSLIQGGIDTDAVKVAKRLHNTGVRIVGLAIGDAENRELPQLVTKDSQGRPDIVKVANHRSLMNVATEVIGRVCQ